MLIPTMHRVVLSLDIHAQEQSDWGISNCACVCYMLHDVPSSSTVGSENHIDPIGMCTEFVYVCEDSPRWCCCRFSVNCAAKMVYFE